MYLLDLIEFIGVEDDASLVGFYLWAVFRALDAVEIACTIGISSKINLGTDCL